jgi:CRISPR-associated protein Csm2
MATTFNGIDGTSKISEWIKTGINQEAIKFAEAFGKDLAQNKLSTSQIRNIFSEIKNLQMKGKEKFSDTQLLLLKPKLAYSKARKTPGGREAAQAAEDLEKILSKGIDDVVAEKHNKFERFQNFANFFEAVLAYHRSFGGK